MNLDVYSTHMELYPYVKYDYPAIEKMYTAEDKFSGDQYPCGYLIEDGKLYLPRGTSISKLEHMCDVKAKYIMENDPIENMSRKFNSLYDPRDKLQEDAIEFLLESNSQAALNLATGMGKSFTVAYAITHLNEKALIITPNESLKEQWMINTFSKMFNYRPKNLMNIAGSNIIEGLMEDLIEPRDVYFVNHQTLQSYFSNTNGYSLHKFFKKLNIGIKVYDESHMQFANILTIDFYSNTKRTWYLTATFDRSDKTESKCFKNAFNSVVTFGEMESKMEAVKHVIYHVVNFNSHITPKDRAKVIGYSGLTGASYGKYAFLIDPNETAYNVILSILKKVKNIDGKILIFVPLIDAVDKVVKQLKRDYPDKSVGAYHSKIPADEKESTKNRKDIIVSTIKSCGTGQDIPGLRVVICLDPIASKVVAEQVVGRIRPYKENDIIKDTYFFDCIDVSIAPLVWWFRSRFKKIETLVKSVVYLNMDK